MAFFSCTVNEIGPAADGAETAEPVIYINLTDTGGSFANRWFYAAERSKTQMLSVGLAAMSTNRPVEAAIDTPDVPYSSVRRMYLMGPGGGGTKLAFSGNIIGTPTGGKILAPIDISPFAKISIFGDHQRIGQHPVLPPVRHGRADPERTFAGSIHAGDPRQPHPRL